MRKKKRLNRRAVKVLRVAKPMKVPIRTARGVPSKASPIGIARAAARIVEMAPFTDAARPAIWPIGSIDSAVRFGKTKLIENMKDVE